MTVRGVLALGVAALVKIAYALAPAGAGMSAVALGVGFPLYVATNPHRFGPATLASPIDGAAGGKGMRPSWRPPTATADAPPGLDTRPTGAVAAPVPDPDEADRASTGPRPRGIPRPFRVIAVAGGAALIEHAGGAEMVRPGDVLPDGRRLIEVRGDGTILTDPADPPVLSPASPAQADTPKLPGERPALVRG